MTFPPVDTFSATPPLNSDEPPHQMEDVVTIDDVQFINDGQSTTVEDAAVALGRCDTIYWIAGGALAEIGYEKLDDYLPKIRHAFLIGEAAPRMADWLQSREIAYTITETLQRGVQAAAHMAWEEDLEGATVLFSPACEPSDQFPNYEARGELFRNAVNALKVEAAG